MFGIDLVMRTFWRLFMLIIEGLFSKQNEMNFNVASIRRELQTIWYEIVQDLQISAFVAVNIFEYVWLTFIELEF